MKNYYEILEVNERASKEIIDNSYNILVNKYHPEKYDGEAKKLMEERLKEINEAYAVISDDFLREQYDKERSRAQENNYQARRSNTEYQKEKEVEEEPKKTLYEKVKARKKVKAKSKIGTMAGLADVTKEVFSNVPKLNKKPQFTKKGVLAFLAAVAIVVAVIVILWFIPFTNGFIKSFLLLD